VSYKAKRQILRSRTSAEFPFLIEITHPTYGVMRFVNRDEDVLFEGNVFTGSCFEVSPPKKEGGDIIGAYLSITDIDQAWIAKIRSTQQRATIRFIAAFLYEDGSLNIEALEDLEFQLVGATWGDTGQINWTMVFDTTLDINIPCDSATFSKVPGVS